VLQNVNSATDAANFLANASSDLLSCRAMHSASVTAAPWLNGANTNPLPIERIETRTIRLPLHEPFETSFGSIDSRLIFLISIHAGGLTGWGEVVAAEEPRYSYETVGTAQHIIRDYLAPAMLAQPVTSLNDLATRFASFRGHNMAKAGLELAYVDLLAQVTNQSLSRMIGGTRSRIPVGVSLGIQPTLGRLLERVEKYLAEGYQRIKLKIKPGWDIEVVREVRRRHPQIMLSVDANSAYAITDQDHLKQLDDFDLLMIEQPLNHDDLVDHAKLQSVLKTAICLDESITGSARAQQALELGSCRIINIKIGRVGGYSQALLIHDLCFARGTPVWCGGMLESGIGRAHNISLASLSGFSLPGDISASARYFSRDVISPEVYVLNDGTVEVPNRAGLGFNVDIDYIHSQTQSLERLEATT
jgi:O-succinylbenzoate synthase